jgi:hypothetical protein
LTDVAALVAAIGVLDCQGLVVCVIWVSRREPAFSSQLKGGELVETDERGACAGHGGDHSCPHLRIDTARGSLLEPIREPVS